MVNIKDIAREAGVSIATVSRLLDPEKRDLVHPETRDRIEKVIRKYSYTPNRAARALSKNASDTIGMVTQFSPDVVRSPYFQGLIAGIIEGIARLEYDLKWIMIREQEQKTCGLQELLQKHCVDGLLFLSWRIFPSLVKEIEQEENIPAVLINDYDRKVRCTIVYCENYNGVEQIVARFREKGFKKIGMIRGPENTSPDARERHTAFKSIAKRLGFDLKDKYFYKCYRFEEKAGYDTMMEWIGTGDLPEAIFCANDDIACGAVAALTERGVAIPNQIAVAGYDDSQRSGTLQHPLTTVRQPLVTLGHAAIETLAKLISKKVKGPIQLKFEPELIVRETC